MYCLGTAETKVLTDEHILARGLNGDLLLPKSTCSDCQKWIGREIETPILKHRWLAHSRLVLGLRSYKPNRQPSDIKLTFVSANGQKFDKKIPKHEAVAAITLPLLIPPRALAVAGALIESNGIEVRGTYDNIVHNKEATKVASTDEQIRALCKRVGAQQIDLQTRVSPPDLCRFLCKTAYGFHVATRGLFPRSESPALAIMCGQQLDYSNWIGSEEFFPAKSVRSMHDLILEDIRDGDGHPCTVVKVHLFNNYGVRMRYVVVTRAEGWKQRLKPDPNPVYRSGEVILMDT